MKIFTKFYSHSKCGGEVIAPENNLDGMFIECIRCFNKWWLTTPVTDIRVNYKLFGVIFFYRQNFNLLFSRKEKT